MNQLLYQFVLEKFPNIKGKVLDLGSGGGFDINSFSGLGWETIAIDKQKPICGKNINIFYEKDLEEIVNYNLECDLTYSLAMIQFLQKPENLVQTIYLNTKSKGFIYILTFDINDPMVGNSALKIETLKNLFKEFKSIEIKKINYYDDEIGHNHWHNLIQLTAQKP